MKTRRIAPIEKEVDLPIPRIQGQNDFGDANGGSVGDFDSLVNWDIFPEADRDLLKSRKGSQFLRPASGATKWPSGTLFNVTTWDTGTNEYAIAQIGTKLYAQNLTTPGNPAEILDFAGSAFTLGASSAADLFVYADRLFVIHPSGNAIIEWASGSSTFKARTLGLAYPTISALSTGSGAISGRYIYGIELVYRSGTADILVSSPNRKASNGTLINTGTITSQKVTLQISATVLDASTLWTHLRLWRSKNLNTDNTDPLYPLDPQGLPEELYEVALITKAEISAGALAAVATGSSLPAGNAGVTAGKPAGVYTLTDNNLDSVLFNLIGLERIELIPLPAATCGCFHAGRVWVDGSTNDDVFYTNAEGTKYSELCDPLAFVQTGRDGTQVKKLISFERDLLVLKETKTGRILGGDPDQPFEVLDPRIGISTSFRAGYLPGIGVCALTNDQGDFKIFGLNLLWTSQFGGQEISRPIRSITKSIASSYVIKFAYINGKIVFNYNTSGGCLALHAQSGRGWTEYRYQLFDKSHLIPFQGGTRAAFVTASKYTVEIEKDVDTDADQSNDVEGYVFALQLAPRVFQVNGGRQILEFQWYSVVGTMSAVLYGGPFADGAVWPNVPGDPDPIAFQLSPSAYAVGNYKDGEYRLYIPPQAVGDFLWQRFQGFFLTIAMSTKAPATIRAQSMRVTVDEDDSSFLSRSSLT